MTPDQDSEGRPSSATIVKLHPDAVPGRPQPAQSRDPSRRGLIAAFVFVVVLACAGYYVVQTMMTMARLQDCAAAGRRDC